MCTPPSLFPLNSDYGYSNRIRSTAEVSEVLGQYPGILEANVYGVQIPHHEGRAGCAAVQITPEAQGTFDFGRLAQFAREKLPKYAVPVFVRLVGSASHIHNHKQNKVPLREEGVDPEKTGDDRVLVLGEKGYRVFERGDWEGIAQGRVQL